MCSQEDFLFLVFQLIVFQDWALIIIEYIGHLWRLLLIFPVVIIFLMNVLINF